MEDDQSGERERERERERPRSQDEDIPTRVNAGQSARRRCFVADPCAFTRALSAPIDRRESRSVGGLIKRRDFCNSAATAAVAAAAVLLCSPAPNVSDG